MPRHLLVLAIALEITSAVVLFMPLSWGLQALIYFLLHAAATPWLARSLWHQLPRRYRVPAAHSIAFLTVMIFALPFVGFLGVLWGLMMALRLPRQRRSLSVQQIAVPSLPFQALTVHTQLPYSIGALRQILRHATSPLKRVKAVMAMRQMPLQKALPILNIALRDRIDDVRLLAYAMCDSEEKKLTETLQQWQQELDDLSPAKQSAVYALLAQGSFELVYCGLVQGAVRAHWLQQALKFAQRATSSVMNDILLARIYLQLTRYDDALSALDAAAQRGAAASVLAVWRAECAFGLRQFAQVKTYLSQIENNGERGSELAMVKAYWLGVN